MTIYRLQYRNGVLSCPLPHDDFDVYTFAKLMDTFKGYGVVAVFKIKMK